MDQAEYNKEHKRLKVYFGQFLIIKSLGELGFENSCKYKIQNNSEISRRKLMIILT